MRWGLGARLWLEETELVLYPFYYVFRFAQSFIGSSESSAIILSTWI